MILIMMPDKKALRLILWGHLNEDFRFRRRCRGVNRYGHVQFCGPSVRQLFPVKNPMMSLAILVVEWTMLRAMLASIIWPRVMAPTAYMALDGVGLLSDPIFMILWDSGSIHILPVSYTCTVDFDPVAVFGLDCVFPPANRISVI